MSGELLYYFELSVFLWVKVYHVLVVKLVYRVLVELIVTGKQNYEEKQVPYLQKIS